MLVKETSDFRPWQTIIQILISVLTAAGWALFSAALFALLLVTKDFRHSLIPVFSWFSCGTGVLVGGILAGYWHRSKGYLVGAGVGILTALLLTAVSVLVWGGPIGLTGWLKLFLLPVIGMAGGMLGIRLRFRTKRI